MLIKNGMLTLFSEGEKEGVGAFGLGELSFAFFDTIKNFSQI